MRTRNSLDRSKRRGFTLVELLVVIGIIALLISILLPSLNKAREAARRVKCLSNMRQIVMAMNMFAQDNQGFMPGRGSNTRYISNKVGEAAWGTASVAADTADWINWSRVIDPVTGSPTSNALNSVGDGNITFSGLARYLGAKPKQHTSAAEANTLSPQLESLYRCPSDKIEQRPQAFVATGNVSVYRYSYSANNLYMNPIKTAGVAGVTPASRVPSPLTKYMRAEGNFNGKIGSIKNTSDRILLICEDEQTITGPSFNPQPYLFAEGSTATTNLLASRHDGTYTKTKSAAISAGGLPTNSRGNVVMADGHGEFIPRAEALLQRHTGNPYVDPDNFPAK